MEMQIQYRRGYKYQLAQTFRLQTEIKPDSAVQSEFISLDLTGLLTLNAGYAWDGVSGTVVDTNKNLRASLVHDALYQLIRQNYLSLIPYRNQADLLFKAILIEDGTWRWLANIYYHLLNKHGLSAADPENKKLVYVAP